MKIKFLINHGDYEVGEVVWIADTKEAQKMAKNGIVELIEPESEPGKTTDKKQPAK
jgi:hypothetical protein